MPRFETVGDIINEASLEMGLGSTTDPVADASEQYRQLTQLLDSAGRQMVKLHQWNALTGKIDVTLTDGESNTTLGDGVAVGLGGMYDLPDDFDHMIDQTGWDRTNRVAVGGPLSAQDWTYLRGRDLVSQSIYASFRLESMQLQLFPQPAPDGLNLTFEYVSRNWLGTGNYPYTSRQDRIDASSNVCLIDPSLMVALLKVRYKSAKGLDTQDDKAELENVFGAVAGQDEGAPILSASRTSRGFPYLSPYYNTGDTGFGGG